MRSVKLVRVEVMPRALLPETTSSAVPLTPSGPGLRKKVKSPMGTEVRSSPLPKTPSGPAKVMTGGHSSVLSPFRFERFATGELHPVSNSPYPLS